MSVRISLTQGFSTIVDDEDAPSLQHHSWKVLKTRGLRYAARTVNKTTTVLMHRLIMQPAVDELIDHRNGDGLDNRRSNLRICNYIQNGGNVSKPKRGKSRFRGVYWNQARGKWQAQIAAGSENEKQKVRYLGRFVSEEDAARAYDKAARDYFGEFATTNFSIRREKW